MKTVYIYGLYDPRTKKLRYIGKASNLKKRLWTHIRDAKGGQRTYKADWIRSLLKQGIEPTIEIIEEVSEKDWQKKEREWIKKSLFEGAKLTNLTRGGDGIDGYYHSEETKKKISKHNKKEGVTPPSAKGRKQSSEHIKKRVEARKKKGNYKHSEETKRKISQKRKGKNLGNTHTLGYKHTEEWKQAARKRSKGEGNAFFGRKHSEETKAKISRNRKGKALGNQNAKGKAKD